MPTGLDNRITAEYNSSTISKAIAAIFLIIIILILTAVTVMCIKYFKNTETNKHVATDSNRCVVVLLGERSRSTFIYDFEFRPTEGFEPSTPEEFNNALDIVDSYKFDFMAKQNRGIKTLLADAINNANEVLKFKLG